MLYVEEVHEDGSSELLHLSEGHKELTGFSLEDLNRPGWEWEARVHPDDRQRYLDEYGRLERDSTSLTLAYRFQRRDGAWRRFEDRSAVIRDTPRGTLLLTGVVTDVTAASASPRTPADPHTVTALLTGLLTSLPDIVFFKDSEGVYLGCNPEFERFVGRSAAEIVGSTDAEMFGKEVGKAFREHDRAMLELGAPRHNEEWITYPDGTEALVDTFKAPLRDASGRLVGLVGVSRDVTEHRRAEEECATSEANYRSLFESVEDLVLVVDADGRVLHANATAIRVLGQATDGIIGARVIDLHPPRLRDEAAVIFAETVKGERASCPLPLLAADGSDFPTETRFWHGTWDGEPCIFGICRDLTAEREAAERFDRVFHMNPAPMAIGNAESRREIVEVNEAWLRTLGYERDQVIGRTNDELGLFPFPDQQLEAARQLLQTGRLRDAPLQVRTQDGRILDGVFAGSLLRVQGKDYFLTVMLDETERRRAENALQELNATLERQVEDRTAQLDTANRELVGFVNSVAHDLRTPLRAIGSWSQVLELDHAAALGDDGVDIVHRITAANGRMERLIESLLDLSGLTHHPLRLADVDLSAVAGKVVAELRRSEPQRTVEVDVQEEMTARLDPDLAFILLENLLGNAWKFTSGREPARIEVGCTNGGPETTFWVRDNGVGFDQRYVGRLFQPFERLHTDAEFAGTGIGLATVRHIVERHDGRAWAEGELDRGATFSFALPAAPAAEARETAGAPARRTPRAGPTT